MIFFLQKFPPLGLALDQPNRNKSLYLVVGHSTGLFASVSRSPSKALSLSNVHLDLYTECVNLFSLKVSLLGTLRL